jgi:PAS domain S-box-containing protein
VVSLNSLGRSERLILSYGVAVVSVMAAVISLMSMEAHWRASAHVSLFLIAVIITTWLGGIKPGLLALALSVLGFNYVLMHVGGSFGQPVEWVRLLSLAVVGAFVVWVTATERGAAESLRRAHDELRRSNDALRIEYAESRCAQEALRVSEAKLRALWESAPSAILIFQAEKIGYANPAASVITGYSCEELLRMSFADIVHPDFRALVSPAFQTPRPGEPVSFRDEVKITTKTGEERWVESIKRRFDLEGKPAVVCIACDITERKKTELALRKNEQLLREAEELGQMGTWEHDLHTGGIYSTAENSRLFFGADRGRDAHFEDYASAVHPEDRESAMAYHTQLLAEDAPRELEFRVVWPDDSIHVLVGRATVVRDASGKPMRIYGTNVDVTERKRAEQAVSESQQLLQLVLATLPVGVAVTDRAGDIILSNAASRRIWGEKMINSGAERWVRSTGYRPDSGQRVAPAEWPSVRALRDGEITLNEFMDIDAFDGRRKTIQASAAPIRNAERQIVGAVIVMDEVTEQVRAQTALQQSAKRLRQLSRRLLKVQEEERRHLSRELHDEFGQLLASITLHLHAAKGVAGASAQSNLDEGIALLQRAGAQVRSLALELRPTMLETGGLESALRWLAQQHQQRTGIVTEILGHLNDVSGDLAIACFRVVQEALTNVVRHARAQHVWIELNQREGSVELVVRDDGVGFDVTTTIERAASGGNLGLLGMRERVEILGGSLEIDSQSGQGTRIRISLPLSEPTSMLAQHTAA